jgi:hypothetical protein
MGGGRRVARAGGLPMRALFHLDDTAERHPSVDRWLDDQHGPLGTMAQRWFEAIRHCGDDVREVLHDGQPTACVSGAAFAYVDTFTSHVNVGFFQGAELPDPKGLLEGTGKFMRHVKLRPGAEVDVAALTSLIDAAYADVKARLAAE